MPTKKDFLKDICADPSNLDARRVYADWLIEHGDPRGEFIAAQMALAEMKGIEANYSDLLASSLRLQQVNAGDWLGGLIKLISLKPEDYGRVSFNAQLNAIFENGFVCQIGIRPEQIDSVWKKLTAIEPLVGAEVPVQEGLHGKEENQKSPGQFQRIKFGSEGWVSSFGVAQTLHWNLNSAEAVDYSGCDLGLDGVRLLLGEETGIGEFIEDYKAPPGLNAKVLKKLRLNGTNILDEGAQKLLGWTGAKKLTALELNQCGIGDAETMEAIAKLNKLTHLAISGNFGDSRIKNILVLKDWKRWLQLESIELPKEIDAESFQTLFSKRSTKLKHLKIVGAKKLVSSPAVIGESAKNLITLNIGSSSIGDDNFAELLELPSMKKCVHLIVNKCTLSDKAIESLVSSKLDRLVTLDISSNKLSDKSMEALANWPGLKNVANLRIRNNRKLTGKSYTGLMESEFFEPASFDVGKVKEKPIEKKLVAQYGTAMQF